MRRFKGVFSSITSVPCHLSSPPLTLAQASHRAAPLLETHASSNPKADDKDAAPVIWDRDLHMGVKGRLMDEKDRHQAIKDAKALGDRFGHGRGGAYV